MRAFLDFNQFIISASKANFFCVFHAGLPIGVWVGEMEMVMVIAMAIFFVFTEDAASNYRLCVAGVSTGNV